MTNSSDKYKTDIYWLSVVVIGRNEGRRLPDLFASLPAGDGIEWLYVDSCSSDSSVEIALASGARVFQVEEGSVYAPGTGRYIGTIEAGGRWILYLDGDMGLRSEFKRFLDRLKEADLNVQQKGHDQFLPGERGEVTLLPDTTAGFVGRTRNCYLDPRGNLVAERDYVVLAKQETGPVESWGFPVKYHGGAVLYRRQAVLESGNWNPAVYQLEEIDLYSRIYARGGIVRSVDLPMVDHYTPYLDQKEKLLLNFLPQWRDKKLYGAGQVVSARLRQGNLLQFIRFYPYPFIIAAGLLTIPLAIFWPLLPIIINLAIVIVIGLIKRKWYFYLVYLGNLLQILRGLGRYHHFEPRYSRIK